MECHNQKVYKEKKVDVHNIYIYILFDHIGSEQS